MKEMIRFDSNKNPSDKYYKMLSKEDKAIVDRFESNCKITANPTRAKKAKANAIRFIIMVGKKVDNINLQDLKDFLGKLKEAKFSDYTTNDIKNYVHRFLKDYFRDWPERFNDFEDIKYDSDPTRKKAIEPADVFKKEQVEKLTKEEPSLLWKTFLVLQYEAALRTIETRTAKWEDLDDNDSEVYWLTVSSKKNKKAKEKKRIAPLSQSIYFLNELRKLQKEKKISSKYIFPSRIDAGIPVSSGTVNKWFSRLTKRVLGKSSTNYLLRHSKGEMFHEMVRDNVMSKEVATRVMGHSEKMFDKTYSHTDNKKLKEVLKKQILNIDYNAPDSKDKIERLTKRLELLENAFAKIYEETTGKKVIGFEEGKLKVKK